MTLPGGGLVVDVLRGLLPSLVLAAKGQRAMPHIFLLQWALCICLHNIGLGCRCRATLMLAADLLDGRRRAVAPEECC